MPRDSFVLFLFPRSCGTNLQVHGEDNRGGGQTSYSVKCPNCGKPHDLPTKALRFFTRKEIRGLLYQGMLRSISESAFAVALQPLVNAHSENYGEMAIFITGSTGYIGSYIVSGLLEKYSDSLNLLVRAKNPREAELRLWQSLQLHLDFPRFHDYLKSRISIFLGDLTDSRFGLNEDDYRRMAHTTDSVIHCAASLNRKSEKSCLNVNLRGTLEVVKFAARARDHHGLQRISPVSTVAVAGHRSNEVVYEDKAIEWDRADYDPYARTKKFCEHMIRELLPDVPRTIFRPSIVLGDSRFAATTQFDMVRAFVFLVGLPLLPFRAKDRVDIVPVDYVADAIVTLHQKEKPAYDIYHLSSGTASQTFRELTDALSRAQRRPKPIYMPILERPFAATVNALSKRRGTLGYGASLLKVFFPYLVWNTVFDNTRVVSELGRPPARFSDYSYPLLKFSKENRFTYKYLDWPSEIRSSTA